MTFDIRDVALSVQHDPQGRFWNSRWNLCKEVVAEYNLPNKIIITDSTIREGEEAPYVVYSLEDKIKVAAALDDIGVDEIDCGFATINQGHLEFLRELNSTDLKIKKSVIARIDLPDFKEGIDEIVEAGADIVLCAFYPTPIPGYDWMDYCKRIEGAVEHCKLNKVFTSFWFTCTRWDEKHTLELYKAAITAGADRIKTAGGGVLTVPAYKRMVQRIKEIAGGAEVGVHIHNNYGLATACTLASIEAGASNVETSVNGLADGAGLASFEEVAMALIVMYGYELNIRTEKMFKLSQLVQEISGIKVQPYKPIVGESVFVETPDTHIEGILRGRIEKKAVDNTGVKRAKSFIDPETIGQKISLLFGPAALGGNSIKLKAQEIGIDIDTRQIEKVLEIMRNKLKTRNAISEPEVENIIQSVTQ